jgi:hypothetical protein
MSFSSLSHCRDFVSLILVVCLVLCLTILLPPGFSLSRSRASSLSLSPYTSSSWFLSLSFSFARLDLCLTILLPSGYCLSCVQSVFVSLLLSCLSHSRSSVLFFVSQSCFLLVLVSLNLVRLLTTLPHCPAPS